MIMSSLKKKLNKYKIFLYIYFIISSLLPHKDLAIRYNINLKITLLSVLSLFKFNPGKNGPLRAPM